MKCDICEKDCCNRRPGLCEECATREQVGVFLFFVFAMTLLIIIPTVCYLLSK